MSKYTIGIDLGGTTMTAGLVNENYEIVAKTDTGPRACRARRRIWKRHWQTCAAPLPKKTKLTLPMSTMWASEPPAA